MAVKRTDRQIVEGLISNNPEIIRTFFYEDFSRTLDYIIKTVFDYRANRDELINELYIYMSDNDWHKVRQFDYRSKLTTWLSVVAIRFFQRKRTLLIENDSSEPLFEKWEYFHTNTNIDNRIDIENALRQMKNERYKKVIYDLDLYDQEPAKVAAAMGISVNNLYNIHRRAHVQLSFFLK